jgi:hypothetical protein
VRLKPLADTERRGAMKLCNVSVFPPRVTHVYDCTVGISSRGSERHMVVEESTVSTEHRGVSATRSVATASRKEGEERLSTRRGLCCRQEAMSSQISRRCR